MGVGVWGGLGELEGRGMGDKVENGVDRGQWGEGYEIVGIMNERGQQ